MKNRVDRAEIFPTAKCGGTECGKKWTPETGGWCRGCNGVYCAGHVDMKDHNCKRTDLIRGNAGASLTAKPEKKSKRKRNKKPPFSSLVPSEDTQLALDETHSGNGKAHG